jgi:hypothetical protein
VETFSCDPSPCSHIEIKVQQMDVKGVYLNGILKETLYINQP